MLEKNCHYVDKQLKSVAKDVDCIIKVDIHHQYALRRGLLNSRYYSRNFFVRWYTRVFELPKRVLVMGTGMSIVVVSVFTFTLYNNNSIAHDINDPYIKTVNAAEFPVEYLQEMYKYGYLSYSHDNPDGCRVYKAEHNGEMMVVHDDQPYLINVVLAN